MHHRPDDVVVGRREDAKLRQSTEPGNRAEKVHVARSAADLDRANGGILGQQQRRLTVEHILFKPVLEKIGDGGFAEALPRLERALHAVAAFIGSGTQRLFMAPLHHTAQVQEILDFVGLQRRKLESFAMSGMGATAR